MFWFSLESGRRKMKMDRIAKRTWNLREEIHLCINIRGNNFPFKGLEEKCAAKLKKIFYLEF